MPSAETRISRPLDLEDLEFEDTPLFVIRTDHITPDFDLLFCNEAFRKLGLRTEILADEKGALLFRAWAHAGVSKPQYDFGGRIWSAHVASGCWKIVRATQSETQEQDQKTMDEDDDDENLRAPVFTRSNTELMGELKRDKAVFFRDTPGPNVHARMMEMSDVGVFEYNPEGKLLHANEAWYRLSSHPRNLPSHVEYSFMDLVYPDDQAIVMSMWNSLTQGKSVTFEMRWKPRKGTDDTAQWVLSACVPVFDDDKKLVSIAGNTIDINAQKRAQEIAQAQVEAHEQARRAELKFERFAQLSPTAIYIYDTTSGMNFVNEQFYELTGYARVPTDQSGWFDLVADEDRERVKENWDSMMNGDKSHAAQFRLKKTWYVTPSKRQINQDGIRSNIWVQSSSYPELDEDGNVISIMGTLFDISQFKWAESVQSRRVEEALEAERQQENFIDMTSHELRNPLSAVIQCADSIITSLQQLPARNLATSSSESDISKAETEVQSCIESLQIIVSCSMHQKRVIDDVLTLSKLDSNLILITPMRVQPAEVVDNAVKMFDVECHQAGIKLEFRIDETFRGMEWAMLDPSRLLQVLINLLTNAIKFTKDRPQREITVTIGGSWTRPPKCWQDVTFTDDDQPKIDITENAEWGNGKRAYLWLRVRDTGCGMTHDEQKKLFSRFSQATPRTHISYGGSGLGLFISKSLTKLQGGAIGVHSAREEGSTFAFYISAKIAHPPADQVNGRAVQARPIPHRTMTGEQSMRSIDLNVLIVEDNLVNQKVLKKQLQKFGWNISVAGDGQEALDWLKHSVYWKGDETHTNGDSDSHELESKHDLDIILMDIEMPVMDGLTCARLIRDYESQGLLAKPAQRTRRLSISPILTKNGFDFDTAHHERPNKQSLRLPILAVSANARMEQVEQALAAGMDDAISKPFRIPELWPKIRGLVKRVEDVDTQ